MQQMKESAVAAKRSEGDKDIFPLLACSLQVFALCHPMKAAQQGEGVMYIYDVHTEWVSGTRRRRVCDFLKLCKVDKEEEVHANIPTCERHI